MYIPGVPDMPDVIASMVGVLSTVYWNFKATIACWLCLITDLTVQCKQLIMMKKKTPPNNCPTKKPHKKGLWEEDFSSHTTYRSASVFSDSYGSWKHPLASSFDGEKGHIDSGNFSGLELKENTPMSYVHAVGDSRQCCLS